MYPVSLGPSTTPSNNSLRFAGNPALRSPAADTVRFGSSEDEELLDPNKLLREANTYTDKLEAAITAAQEKIGDVKDTAEDAYNAPGDAERRSIVNQLKRRASNGEASVGKISEVLKSLRETLAKFDKLDAEESFGKVEDMSFFERTMTLPLRMLMGILKYFPGGKKALRNAARAIQSK